MWAEGYLHKNEAGSMRRDVRSKNGTKNKVCGSKGCLNESKAGSTDGIRNKVCGPEGHLHESEVGSTGRVIRSRSWYEK